MYRDSQNEKKNYMNIGMQAKRAYEKQKNYLNKIG